jgi:hypothetical protein
VADIVDGDGVGAETQRIEWLINPDRGNPARPGVRDGRWYRSRYRGRRLTCGHLVES